MVPVSSGNGGSSGVGNSIEDSSRQRGYRLGERCDGVDDFDDPWTVRNRVRRQPHASELGKLAAADRLQAQLGRNRLRDHQDKGGGSHRGRVTYWAGY